MPVATLETAKLIAAAHCAPAAIWKPGYPYKKDGVMLLHLREAAQFLKTLIDAVDSPAAMAQKQAIDQLNAKYGRDTVTFAVTGRRRC